MVAGSGTFGSSLQTWEDVYGVVNLKTKRCHPSLAPSGRERILRQLAPAMWCSGSTTPVCSRPLLIPHTPMPIRKHRRIPLPLGQRVRDDIILRVENGQRREIPYHAIRTNETACRGKSNCNRTLPFSIRIHAGEFKTCN